MATFITISSHGITSASTFLETAPAAIASILNSTFLGPRLRLILILSDYLIFFLDLINLLKNIDALTIKGSSRFLDGLTRKRITSIVQASGGTNLTSLSSAFQADASTQ